MTEELIPGFAVMLNEVLHWVALYLLVGFTYVLVTAWVVWFREPQFYRMHSAEAIIAAACMTAATWLPLLMWALFVWGVRAGQWIKGRLQ
jgi:hypothetical protein